MRAFFNAIQSQGRAAEDFDAGATVARSSGVGEGDEELVLRLRFECGHRFASHDPDTNKRVLDWISVNKATTESLSVDRLPDI